MADVVIGGTTHNVPELNFIALEKAWPFIDRAIMTQDPLEGCSAGISIVACGLIEAEGFSLTAFNINEDDLQGLNAEQRWDKTFDLVTHFLKRKLKAKEIPNVREAIDAITLEAGLREEDEDKNSGEALAPVEDQANPSAETAQNSSLNSSPQDAREEAGTE